MDYTIPSGNAQTELEIKKSRFLAFAHTVETREQAMAILDQSRQAYPDARHHCWAYRIGNPNNPSAVAFSDDGEPGGTAGKPMLNVLEHKNIGDVFIIVVRYFGGIKLGAGGLVRAYSGAAQAVMEALQTTTKVFLSDIYVLGGFALEQALRHWLDSHQGTLVSVEYSEIIQAHIRLRPLDFDALEAFVLAQGGELKTYK